MKFWTLLFLIVSCSQNEKKIQEAFLKEKFGGSQTLQEYYGDKKPEVKVTDSKASVKINQDEYSNSMPLSKWKPVNKSTGLVIESLSKEKYLDPQASLDSLKAQQIIEEVKPLGKDSIVYSEVRNERKISWKISPFVVVQINKHLDGAICVTKNLKSYCEGSFLDESRFEKFKALVKSYAQHVYGGYPLKLFETIDSLWKESKDNKTYNKKLMAPEKYQSSNWEIEVSRLEPSDFFSLKDFEKRTTTVRVKFN